MMNRRDILKTAGLVLGYTIAGGTAAAVLGGCSADPKSGWTPSFISESEAKLIRAIADAIIPGTDKLPGAKDVMIDKFFDERLIGYAKPDEKAEFKEGMAALAKAMPNLSSASEEDRLGYVKAELESDSKFMKKQYEMSVTGFCTSERGAKEVLVFDPIPGEYIPVLPVEDVGGIWAL